MIIEKNIKYFLDPMKILKKCLDVKEINFNLTIE